MPGSEAAREQARIPAFTLAFFRRKVSSGRGAEPEHRFLYRESGSIIAENRNRVFFLDVLHALHCSLVAVFVREVPVKKVDGIIVHMFPVSFHRLASFE